MNVAKYSSIKFAWFFGNYHASNSPDFIRIGLIIASIVDYIQVRIL